MLLFGGAQEKTAGIRLFFVLPFCLFIPLFRSFPARRLDGYRQSRTEDENATQSRLKQLWQRLLGPFAVKRIAAVDQHLSALQHSAHFDDGKIYCTLLMTEQRETPGRNKSPENRLPREMSGTTRIERKVRELSKLATKKQLRPRKAWV